MHPGSQTSGECKQRPPPSVAPTAIGTQRHTGVGGQLGQWGRSACPTSLAWWPTRGNSSLAPKLSCAKAARPPTQPGGASGSRGKRGGWTRERVGGQAASLAPLSVSVSSPACLSASQPRGRQAGQVRSGDSSSSTDE